MATQGTLEAQTAGDRRREAAAPAPAILGRPVPDRLWRYRWAFAAGAWAIGAVAIYLTPLGGHMNPYLSLSSFVVGLLMGLTGMGSGALMTPLLIILFGVQPTLAVGTDITYAAVTRGLGSWRHFTQRTVDLPVALWLALGSIPAGLAGASAVHITRRTHAELVDAVLYRTIGAALVLVGTLLVVRLVVRGLGDRPDRDNTLENIHLSLRRKLATVAFGAAAGFTVGVTSVGGGTLLVTVLILFYPLAASRVVGTVLFHSLLLLAATGVVQWRFGNVDPALVGALLLGSVPGVILGSHMTLKTPGNVLRGIVGLVLLASGVALLLKA
ncbi:MAG: sulfite exporter TauE/SafE family protein [Actinobacteria bacterium]|nr:sulfite exporter TauE/SafE family protein [Actinomycetota bacterium]